MSAVILHTPDPAEHCAPPDDGVEITEADEQSAIAAWIPKINAFDTLEEMYDPAMKGALDIAIARGDARLIGQLFLAARKEFATRIALRELHGMELKWATPAQVANEVFLAATSAQLRRHVDSFHSVAPAV